MRFTLDDSPFAGLTGRGVIVAVLDSGIHADHPHVGGVQGGASLVGDEADFLDRIGHGTAVAAAIREKGPAVDLIAVRVFDRQLSTTTEILARAIVLAADRGAQLINLSLGTSNAERADQLSTAIEHAASKGALVVSARESNDVVWLPGSLPGVAGVIADWSCERDALTVDCVDAGLPRFQASAYPRPIPGVPRERNLSGVSFAVANTTGFLARAVESAGGDPFEAVARLTSSS